MKKTGPIVSQVGLPRLERGKKTPQMSLSGGDGGGNLLDWSGCGRKSRSRAPSKYFPA